MRLRKNSRPYKILKAAALGAGFLVFSTISPMSGAILVKGLIKEYFRRKYFERRQFLKDLKNLQNRELVDYQELSNGQVKITITQNGKKKVLSYAVDDLKLKKPKRWDSKWRLIIFDIPHSHKRARDAFRQKLRNLEFYPLQKSVLITPYPCEDELEFLASIFDIRKYILILYVSRFEGEEKLKHYFKL